LAGLDGKTSTWIATLEIMDLSYLGVYLIISNKLTKSENDDLLFATLESL